MPKQNKTEEFLQTVRAQIRWQKTHKKISEEIENHIIDQKHAFEEQGMDENSAVEKAVEEMGDPVEVGMLLDRENRPRPEWSVLLLAIALLAVGSIFYNLMMVSAGYGFSFSHIINRLLTGILFIAIGYLFDFSFFGKFQKIVYYSYFILLAVLLSLPANAEGFFLIFPVVYAGAIFRMRNKSYAGLIICAVLYVSPAAVCLTIPLVNVFLIITVSCLSLITIAVVKGWFNVKKLNGLLAIYLPVLSVLALTVIFFGEKLFSRLASAVDPNGMGYKMHVTQQLVTQSRLFGQSSVITGMEHHIMGSEYYNIIHRLGWVAFAAMVLVISALLIRTLIMTKKQNSILAKLINYSVVLTIFAHLFISCLNALGILPFYSVDLPFAAYFGFMGESFLVGILLSVFKSGRFVEDRSLMADIKAGRRLI